MAKRYVYYKLNSTADVLINMGIVVTLGVIILLFFFNSLLPAITYHRETVTVPDLVGIQVDELGDFLERRDLSFVIQDSSYSRKHRPNVVLTQSPEPGAKVKRNRKLMITINPNQPPKVKMPSLVGMPFSEARRTLRMLILNWAGFALYRM
ncbi:MAG: PASTA domain-containing protein [Bacteroidia bacterium]|nr:PASTA domain-containing protein [Bacteroidia bacterium]